jgi:hypothetical protein
VPVETATGLGEITGLIQAGEGTDSCRDGGPPTTSVTGSGEHPGVLVELHLEQARRLTEVLRIGSVLLGRKA